MHTATLKKANSENVSLKTAVYHLMADIENYDIAGGLKNEISGLVIQKYAIEQIIAPRERAITTLMRLQSLGITDEEILNVYGCLNRAKSEMILSARR